MTATCIWDPLAPKKRNISPLLQAMAAASPCTLTATCSWTCGASPLCGEPLLYHRRCCCCCCAVLASEISGCCDIPPASTPHLSDAQGCGPNHAPALLCECPDRYLNPDWKPEDGGQLRVYPFPQVRTCWAELEGGPAGLPSLALAAAADTQGTSISPFLVYLSRLPPYRMRLTLPRSTTAWCSFPPCTCCTACCPAPPSATALPSGSQQVRWECSGADTAADNQGKTNLLIGVTTRCKQSSALCANSVPDILALPRPRRRAAAAAHGRQQRRWAGRQRGERAGAAAAGAEPRRAAGCAVQCSIAQRSVAWAVCTACGCVTC